MPVSKDDIRAKAAQDPILCYERAGLPPGALRRVGSNLQGRCPFHEDSTPSFTIFKDGGFRCFGCGASGDVIAFFMRRHGVADFAHACERLGAFLGVPDDGRARQPAARPVSDTHRRPEPLPLTEALVEELHAALLADQKRLTWLTERKHLPLWIIREAKLGLGTSPHVNWGGLRYTIPVPDLHDGGVWRDIRGYRPGASRGNLPKALPWQAGRGSATVYPWCWVSGMGELVWCEGEVDCLNLIGRGVGAVTATCGAGGALGSLVLPNLAGKTLFVCGDADEAGRRMNAELPSRLYAAGAKSVRVVCWEEVLGGA